MAAPARTQPTSSVPPAADQNLRAIARRRPRSRGGHRNDRMEKADDDRGSDRRAGSHVAGVRQRRHAPSVFRDETIVDESKGVYEMHGSLVGTWYVTSYVPRYQSQTQLAATGKERFVGCLDTNRNTSCDSGERPARSRSRTCTGRDSRTTARHSCGCLRPSHPRWNEGLRQRQGPDPHEGHTGSEERPHDLYRHARAGGVGPDELAAFALVEQQLTRLLTRTRQRAIGRREPAPADIPIARFSVW